MYFLLQASELDGLPGQICVECVDALRQSIQFKQQCENAYETLKSVLGVYIETTKPPDDDVQPITDPVDDGIESEPEEDLHAAAADNVRSVAAAAESLDCGPNEKCIQTEDICFYPCEMCEMKFFKEDALKEHRATHKNKESRFKCRYCDRNYTRLSHLRRHINVAHPEVVISGKLEDIHCKECDKHFTRHDHLRRHVSVFHRDQSEQSKFKAEHDHSQSDFDQHENCTTEIVA